MDDAETRRLREAAPGSAPRRRRRGSSPFLAQVVTAGGTTAGHYLKYRPCKLGQYLALAEGAAATVTPEGGATDLAVLLRSTVFEGDLVKVSWAPDRWVAERLRYPRTCEVILKFHVKGCNNTPLEGATIYLSQPDGTTIGTFLTDSAGLAVAFSLVGSPDDPVRYTYTIIHDDYLGFAGYVDVHCGTVDLTPHLEPLADHICVCGCSVGSGGWSFTAGDQTITGTFDPDANTVSGSAFFGSTNEEGGDFAVLHCPPCPDSLYVLGATIEFVFDLSTCTLSLYAVISGAEGFCDPTGDLSCFLGGGITGCNPFHLVASLPAPQGPSCPADEGCAGTYGGGHTSSPCGLLSRLIGGGYVTLTGPYGSGGAGP